MQLQALVARESDPLQPVVLSTTTFHGGEAVNAIPASARLTGTVRAFDEVRSWGLSQSLRASE